VECDVGNTDSNLAQFGPCQASLGGILAVGGGFLFRTVLAMILDFPFTPVAYVRAEYLAARDSYQLATLLPVHDKLAEIWFRIAARELVEAEENLRQHLTAQ
jgi:hypothetical protein